jgi:hypothetical protein
MKKFLLLLVAAVLVSGLVLSCAQPSSYEVTLAPGSAPEVDGTKITAAALTNAILVKWDSAQDSGGYYVYRKEVDKDETLVSRTNSVSYTPKGVPYYFDTGIANGKKYQYGIVSYSYKSGTDVVLKSEIIWQSETETNKFVEAKVSAPGEVTVTPPTYKVAAIDNIAETSGQSNYAEKWILTFTGLVPGISYSFQVQQESQPSGTTLTESHWSTYNGTGNSFTYNFTNGSNSTVNRIGAFVDNANTIAFSTEVSAPGNATTDTYKEYSYRVKATYTLPTTSTTGTVILYPTDEGNYIKAVPAALDGTFTASP